MARRPPFSRNRTPEISGKKFIIVCEGKTEYNYFRAIRSSMRIKALQVQIANPDASDPYSIVTKAIEIRALQAERGGWAKDDTAWTVFDGDEHIENNPENWRSALLLAGAKGINLAISNPNVEFWFLLHFQDQQANIHRDSVRRKLERYMPRYDKGADCYENHLAARTPDAIARARGLADRIVREGWEYHRNPSTGIYDLVERLLELGKT